MLTRQSTCKSVLYVCPRGGSARSKGSANATRKRYMAAVAVTTVVYAVRYDEMVWGNVSICAIYVFVM